MGRGALTTRVATLAAAICLWAAPGAASASVGNFAMAVQPDGKIIVAGGSGRVGGAASGKEFGAVVRYEPDGSLDRSFGGGDGVVLARQLQPITGLALEPDGRIFVVSPGGTLSRLLQNGSFDQSFGVGGTSPPGAISAYFPTSVAYAGEAGILVGGMTGYLSDPGEHWYGRLYLYPPDGLTSSWVGSMTSGDGRVGEPKTYLNDFVIGAGGTVFGVGTAAAREPAARSQAALAELVPGPTDGVYPSGPNPSFGGGAGLVRSSFLPSSPLPEAANALSWDRGKLLLAGQAGGKFLLARYSPDGTLDAGFGRGGVAFNGGRSPGSADANAVAVLRGGDIVAAGSRAYRCGFDEGCESLVVARYMGNGKLDTRFRSHGFARPPIPIDPTVLLNKEVAYGVTVLSKGRILVGGLATGPEASHFFLRRYLADGRSDRSFGASDSRSIRSFGVAGRVTTLPLVAGTPAPGSGRRVLEGRG